MNDKIFVGNGKEHVFQDGGSIVKLRFSAKDLKTMNGMLNDKGYINLVLTRRKEPSQHGDTHYMTVDTWVPKQENTHNIGTPSFNQEQKSSYDSSMDQQQSGQGFGEFPDDCPF